MRQMAQKAQLTESKGVKLTNVFGQNAGECRKHGHGDGGMGTWSAAVHGLNNGANNNANSGRAARCSSLLTIVSETLTECRRGTEVGS